MRAGARWGAAPRSARLLLAAAGVVLALAILPVLATHLLLRTSILRGLLNGNPESLFVEWSGPHVGLPGHVGFDALTLRSNDHNVEFEARLEDVDVRIGLPDLVARRFHARRVRAARLVFRLRELLTRAEATPARLARYPRIPGYPDPPLLEPEVPQPDKGRPWRVVVEDLAVSRVSEIWIDAWRWKGSGRLRGGFELLPGREARVFPSGLDVEEGVLDRGATSVAHRTRGAVWCEIPRFDTQAFPGNDVWKLISGGASLRGTLESVAFLTADGDEGPKFTGGHGDIQLGTALTDGRGRARVAAVARGVRVATRKKRLRGSVGVQVRLPQLDFHVWSAAFDASRITLEDVGVDGPPERAWGAELRIPMARIDIATGSFDGRLEGRLSDARPVVALLPPGLPKWAAGLLDLSDLTVTGRATVGHGFLDITGARATAGSFELRADYRVRPDGPRGAILVKKGALALGLGLDARGSTLHLVEPSAWFEKEAQPGGLRWPGAASR
jgi:hypothetical protein